MTRRQRRLAFLTGAVGAAVLATVIIVAALGDRVLYFYSPSEAKARGVEVGRQINLGGLVSTGSIERPGGLEVRFKVTDGDQEVPVTYSRDLPDLFREGQGVVVTGSFRQDGVFAATNVLAKHDENYMPPEVAQALKDKGLWKHNEPPAKAP
ncbi:MAG: cytochrome c maturation protein CcmE [Alphaproteobacteria bacterium]|nr:cytochrome c maturation protein CcmE [Alphaproteobacteria bacterium]